MQHIKINEQRNSQNKGMIDNQTNRVIHHVNGSAFEKANKSKLNQIDPNTRAIYVES